MARARNIKPGFFTNDVLTECSFPARLLFAGLWLIADREGRLEDRPKKIKGEIFPHDNLDIDQLLNELAKHAFIIRYQTKESKYIQILNFSKHQNPHVKEGKSTIPAPDLSDASIIKFSDKPGLLPITDSPIPYPPVSPPTEQDAKPPRRVRGERLEAFMAREFAGNPTGCPQEWGEAAVAAANAYRPQTKTDFTKIINWHFDKFFSHFKSSTKANALKSDWPRAWLNWWKSEFERIAKQEERDEFYAQKRA